MRLHQKVFRVTDESGKKISHKDTESLHIVVNGTRTKTKLTDLFVRHQTGKSFIKGYSILEHLDDEGNLQINEDTVNISIYSSINSEAELLISEIKNPSVQWNDKEIHQTEVDKFVEIIENSVSEESAPPEETEEVESSAPPEEDVQSQQPTDEGAGDSTTTTSTSSVTTEPKTEDDEQPESEKPTEPEPTPGQETEDASTSSAQEESEEIPEESGGEDTEESPGETPDEGESEESGEIPSEASEEPGEEVDTSTPLDIQNEEYNKEKAYLIKDGYKEYRHKNYSFLFKEDENPSLVKIKEDDFDTIKIEELDKTEDNILYKFFEKDVKHFLLFDKAKRVINILTD